VTDGGTEPVPARMLNASRAAHWRCWTAPALFQAGGCPSSWRAEHARVGPRPGGEVSCATTGRGGERLPVVRVFLGIVPYERRVTSEAFRPDRKPSPRAVKADLARFDNRGDGSTASTALARHWPAETTWSCT